MLIYYVGYDVDYEINILNFKDAAKISTTMLTTMLIFECQKSYDVDSTSDFSEYDFDFSTL